MRDLSLTLLRHGLAARRDQARYPQTERPPRPAGRLLWVHIDTGASKAGLDVVLRQLEAELDDVTVLVTGESLAYGISDHVPPDTATGAQSFLDHWRPSVCLFAGDGMFPVLWSNALARGIPLLAVDIDTSRHAYPLIRAMRTFDAVMARAPDHRIGSVIEVMDDLATVPPPPPVSTHALAGATSRIGARPTWVAYWPNAVELPLVLAAQRHASRMAHRLLLLLVTDDPTTARNALQDEDMRQCDADADPVPSEAQVLVADAQPELWLRAAPVAFIGGTLCDGGPVLSPALPATLGAALLVGPRRADSSKLLERLIEADGARVVRDGEALSNQVERLLNSDEAAALAHNAWSVTSEGAEASARLYELLDDTLAGVPE